jgi:UDP-N-acetylglucosamine 2-epimerase (non-hydrolysing)
MKALIVLGTRPEAIKLAPVIHALQTRSRGTEIQICNTGQHPDLVDPVFNFFGIRSTFQLRCLKPNQDLIQGIAQLLLSLQELYQTQKPDWIVVQGDTTTCMAASLAAFYRQIPVAHVEAGLRTYQLKAPWPEEANRRMTTLTARWHFAPTTQAAANLQQEGISADKVWVTGNTVIDALFLTLNRITTSAELTHKVQRSLAFLNPLLKTILVTSHRREAIGPHMKRMAQTLNQLTEIPNVQVVIPVHPNPNVKKIFMETCRHHHRLHLIPPLTYPEFVYLMWQSHLIITDSGGVQEEGPSLGKPVLVIRESTERPEGLQTGRVHLVGYDADKLLRLARVYLNQSVTLSLSPQFNPYGDGRASERIADVLVGSNPYSFAQNQPEDRP